jgi:hypothetical protein
LHLKIIRVALLLIILLLQVVVALDGLVAALALAVIVVA